MNGLRRAIKWLRPSPTLRAGQAFRVSDVAVVGGGPSGMTVALLLARAGHHVVLHEQARELGGLWAANLDDDGFFLGENSCKVYQSTYHAAPALFPMLGTRWQAHFVPRHDLRTQWLAPFVADSSFADLARTASRISPIETLRVE